MAWVNPVLGHLGLPPLTVERNLQQSRAGGYDLIGVDWLALEVKRHENLQVSQWWKQTLRQTGEGQVPMLMYRQNRTPWKFRAVLPVAHWGPHQNSVSRITADLSEEAAQLWVQTETYIRHVGLPVVA